MIQELIRGLYKQKGLVKVLNQFALFRMKIGIAPKYQYVLSVRGRKSGKLYSTPVYVIEEGMKKWLVSPYGEVAWVHNARVAGRIVLKKGMAAKEYNVNPISARESAPILKKYLTLAPITQPYFRARPDSALESFEAEVQDHPVFEVAPIASRFES